MPNTDIEWAVLTFNGTQHVVPYLGDEMAGWHDPKMECKCKPYLDDGVIVHRLVSQ